MRPASACYFSARGARSQPSSARARRTPTGEIMNLTSCPYEKELRELMARGQCRMPAPGASRARKRCRSCATGADFRSLPARTRGVAPPRGRWPLRFCYGARNCAPQCRRGTHRRPLLGAQIFACAVALLPLLDLPALRRAAALRAHLELLARLACELPQAAAAQWTTVSAGSQTGSAWNWLVLLPALATLLLLAACRLRCDRQTIATPRTKGLAAE